MVTVVNRPNKINLSWELWVNLGMLSVFANTVVIDT